MSTFFVHLGGRRDRYTRSGGRVEVQVGFLVDVYNFGLADVLVCWCAGVGLIFNTLHGSSQ